MCLSGPVADFSFILSFLLPLLFSLRGGFPNNNCRISWVTHLTAPTVPPYFFSLCQLGNMCWTLFLVWLCAIQSVVSFTVCWTGSFKLYIQSLVNQSPGKVPYHGNEMSILHSWVAQISYQVKVLKCWCIWSEKWQLLKWSVFHILHSNTVMTYYTNLMSA